MDEQHTRQQTQLSYQRSFSALGEYQQAYDILYQLTMQGDAAILSIAQGGKCDQVVLALPQEKAALVLTLLYEQAVSIELWRDVLMELSLPLVG